MPKQPKKGNNNSTTKRLLVEPDSEQVYGIVQRALGNSYFDVHCLDNKNRRCKVRSKKIRIATNDLIIVSLRDFDVKSGDIIYKYEYTEVLELQKLNKIPKEDKILGGEVQIGRESDRQEDLVAFDFENI